MRAMPFSAFFILTLVACEDTGYSLSIKARPNEFEQVGDTIRIEVQESVRPLAGSLQTSLPPSTQAPQWYTWTSSAANVADVSANGVVVFRGQGAVDIGVTSANAAHAVFHFTACSRSARLVITPHDTSVTLGDTLRLTSIIGAPGEPTCFRPGSVVLTRLVVPGTAGVEILDGFGTRYRAAQAGTERYFSTFLVGDRTLADTIRVTVK